jgi:hypothetical protein
MHQPCSYFHTTISVRQDCGVTLKYTAHKQTVIGLGTVKLKLTHKFVLLKETEVDCNMFSETSTHELPDAKATTQ